MYMQFTVSYVCDFKLVQKGWLYVGYIYIDNNSNFIPSSPQHTLGGAASSPTYGIPHTHIHMPYHICIHTHTHDIQTTHTHTYTHTHDIQTTHTHTYVHTTYRPHTHIHIRTHNISHTSA